MSMLSIQKQLFQKLTSITQEFYQNSHIFGLLLVVASSNSDITQTEIADITGWSAGRISETLTEMIKNGLIISVKISHSRKKGYRLAMSLMKTYEQNFRRIFAQFKSGSSLPPNIISKFQTLQNQFPDSKSIRHFGKYLKLYSKANERITELMESFSLENQSILKFPEIKNEMQQLGLKFRSFFYPKGVFLERYSERKASQSIETAALSQVMKTYLEFFQILMQRMERNVDVGLILNTFFINYYPLNQDQIMELTNLPRSTLSTHLKELQNQNLVKEIEIPNDRHKYYHIAFPRKAFLFGKQLKSLAISIKMQEIVTFTKNQCLKMTFENDEEKEYLIQYLATTITAFHRMNTQMLAVVRILGEDLSK